jgi:hypothetical protein
MRGPARSSLRGAEELLQRLEQRLLVLADELLGCKCQ